MTKKYALGILHNDSSWETGERYNLSWLPDAEKIWNMDQFRDDPRPKILIVNCFNPGHEFPCQGDYSWVDLIISVTSECCNYNLVQIQTAVSNKNVIVVAGGQMKKFGDATRIWSPLVYWISQTFENNHYVPTTSPDQKKPYLFDALLGANKDNRAYVFYRLFEDGLLDNSLVSIWRQASHNWQNLSISELDEKFNNCFLTNPFVNNFAKKYGSLDGKINFYRSPALDELELPDLMLPKSDQLGFNSMVRTPRFTRDRPNDLLGLSQEIPTKIYNASWYSIIAETQFNNDHVFITEKTGKALVAKRVFVLFAAQGCLEFLRSQGFRTFESIIDEGYDSEPDNGRRFDRAWEQVRLLNTLDPVEVYRQAESVLEHNYNLLPELRNEHLKIRDFIAQWLPT